MFSHTMLGQSCIASGQVSDGNDRTNWFTDSPISPVIALLTQCSTIAVNVHECRDESQDYW